MSAATVLVKDIIESAEKYGDDNILTWSPDKFRDNKKNNKNSKFDCTWVPFEFKYINGTKSPLRIKFMKVVTSSGAKLPQASDGEIKNMLIAFRKMTEEELLVGDYKPKTMDTQEEQDIEDNRMKAIVNDLLTATNDFNRALEIVDKSYQKICLEIKDAKSLDYTVRKNKVSHKTNKDIPVFPIRQTHREDKEDSNKTIKLEMPLTRIKLLLNKSGQVGIEMWNSNSKGWDFRPNVYDSRKMNKKNPVPVLATVKVNGKSCPLDKENASTFITYKSVIGGVVDFPEIVISKFGLSLANKFKDLYVKRNKSNLTESVFSQDDLKSMVDNNDNDSGSDSDVELITDKVNDVSMQNNTNNNADDNSSLGDSDNSDLEDGCKDNE